jgi:hypothetical protein
MQATTTEQPGARFRGVLPVAITKGGCIGSSASHVWGRDADPRSWIVIPAKFAEPVFHAVTDDFGTLRKVGPQ